MNINHYPRNKSALMLAIGLLLLLLVPASGWTATYYVGTTGNDNNSCSAAQNIGTPKHTIGNARNCLSAGDTLYVRGGTYQESNIGGWPGGISWASPVTIKAYPGDAAAILLSPSGAVAAVGLQQTSEQYIIFDSLVFDGNNKTGGTVYVTGYPGPVGAHHIRFLNCEFRNSGGEISVSHTHHNEWIGGSIHDNDTADGLRHGIYLSTESTDNLVDGMSIYNNLGYGIHVFTYDGSSRNNIFRNNFVYNNGTGVGQCGILYAGGSDGLVYNNVVYENGGGGICIGHATSSSNIGVYNNTVAGNAGGSGFPGLYIASGTGNIVRNNIVWDNGTADYTDLASGTVADHNLLTSSPR
jgi:hypothetical protein